MVAANWSLAVFEATHRFDEFRPVVLVALTSARAEVRSAAVAVLNEANDQRAHDQVADLLNDSDHGVRVEVLEYLSEFSIKSDAPALLSLLQQRQQLFLVSSALRRLYPEGPTINDDDSEPEQRACIAKWSAILGAC